MESIQVHQPFLDRAINFYQAADINEIKFDTKKLLQQAINTNENLKRIQKQLDDATLLNKQILQIQLNEERNKFEQKFYKDLSFNLCEKTELLQQIDDKIVLVYFLKKYTSSLETELKNTTDLVHEISDKIFNKQTYEKLLFLNKSIQSELNVFNDDELSKIDGLFLDFENKKLEIKKLAYPTYLEIKKIKKLNFFNLVGIIFFSILALGAIISSFMHLELIIPNLVIFGIPLFFLIRSRMSNYKKIIQQKKDVISKIESNLLLKQKNEEKMKIEKDNLYSHPFSSALTAINLKHKSFDHFFAKFDELTRDFEKKWGMK